MNPYWFCTSAAGTLAMTLMWKLANASVIWLHIVAYDCFSAIERPKIDLRSNKCQIIQREYCEMIISRCKTWHVHLP
ncbi:hypothetical protein HDV63DRAFT_382135 [Trichoderma sp. SZMC 28014]